MAVDTFSCPECSVKLRRSPQLKTGARVQCPKCRFQFVVPPEDEGEVPPVSRARRDADDFDSPRGNINPRGEIERDPDRAGYADRVARDRKYDEDERANRRYRDADDEPPTRRRYADDDDDYPRGSGVIGGPDDLSNRYTFDIGRYFSIGFKHWGSFTGPFIGYFFLMLLMSPILIIGLIPPLGLFFLPQLAAGPYIVALAQLKGKEWTFGDFFSGFNYFVPLMLSALLQALILFVCYLPYLAGLGIGLAIEETMKRRAAPLPVLFILAGMLVSLVAVIFVQTKLYYTQFLILDRRFSAMDAIKGSWKLTKDHFWITFAFNLLVQLVAQVGAMVCYVGLLFSVPLAICLHTAAYLSIAGSEPPVMDDEADRRPRRRSARDDRYDRDDDF